MSPRRPRRRQDEETANERHPFADVTSLVLIGAGTLLFLALHSYTPDDVPPGFSFSSRAVPNDPVTNIIGPFGAVTAGFGLLTFGAAAFLLPVFLIWLGLARLLMNARLLGRPLGGFVLAVVSGAVLLGIQTTFFTDWWREYNIFGPGGGVGFMGNKMAQSTIGTVGGLVVAIVGYAAGMILLLGIRLPVLIATVRHMVAQVQDVLSGRRQDAQAELAAVEAKRQLTEFQKAERERKRLEKELRQNSSADPLPDDFIPLGGSMEPEQDELPLAEPPLAGESGLPAPRIIDGSARRDTGEKKMSLSEWRQQQQDKARAAGAPAGDAAGGALATGDFRNYVLPPLEILHWDEAAVAAPADVGYLRSTQNNIIRTLSTFGIQVTPGDITRGPTITRYEIYPSEGLRVSRISALEADLARATRAERINILAPIPGKDTVGIEIANKDKVAVPLRELLEDPAFSQGKLRLPIALGKDVYGETIVADLAGMPHLLVAGATGSGKSVCINSIIGSLLFQFTPDQLRFIMVDPKVVEMQIYNDLPHLVVPVVTDPKKVLMALRWVVNEMEHRYRMFAGEGVRNFETFNNRKAKAAELAAAAVAKAVAAALAAGEPPPAPPVTGKGKPKTPEPTPLLPLFDAVPTPAKPEPAEKAASEPMGEYSAFSDDDGYEIDNAPRQEEEEIDEPEAPVSRNAASRPAEKKLTLHQVRIDDTDDDADGEEGDDIWDGSALVAADDPEPEDTIPDRIPYIVVIIDELADLMQTAPADMEGLIARIAQKARAAGIHLIVATQTPRADVVTGIIKANIPCRIAFQVSSALDSRVILDTKGADKLVGKGDMLYLPPGTAKMVRAQGAFVTDDEISALVQHCKEQGGGPRVEKSIDEAINGTSRPVEKISQEDEDTLQNCIEVVMQERKASTSLLQRRLRLGYGRAARMMDLMEQRGIIGPSDGPTKPREILIDLDDDDD